MARRTHVFFGVVLCCLLVLPLLGVVSAHSPSTTTVAAPQPLTFGVKDLVSLGVLLASVVSAVWFLSFRIGKIESRVASLESSFISQEKKLEEVAQNQRDASNSRQELWKEINGVRERVAVRESVCEQRHGSPGQTGSFPIMAEPKH